MLFTDDLPEPLVHGASENENLLAQTGKSDCHLRPENFFQALV